MASRVRRITEQQMNYRPRLQFNHLIKTLHTVMAKYCNLAKSANQGIRTRLTRRLIGQWRANALGIWMTMRVDAVIMLRLVKEASAIFSDIYQFNYQSLFQFIKRQSIIFNNLT